MAHDLVDEVEEVVVVARVDGGFWCAVELVYQVVEVVEPQVVEVCEAAAHYFWVF